jgi:hypothetical protein
VELSLKADDDLKSDRERGEDLGLPWPAPSDEAGIHTPRPCDRARCATLLKQLSSVAMAPAFAGTTASIVVRPENASTIVRLLPEAR